MSESKQKLADEILELIRKFEEAAGEKVEYATYYQRFGTVAVRLESDEDTECPF